MTITTSDEYYCVSLITPTLAMIKWRNANPVKIPGTKKTNEVYWAKEKAALAEARATYTRHHAILKAAGLHRDRRFQYEATAKKYAAEIERDYGVPMDVAKGCDLYL